MVFEMENALRINSFIENSSGISKTDRTQRIIWSDGNPRDLEVLRIHLEHLTYNFDNIRVEFQIRAKERKLGYNLDFETNDHREIFSGMFEDTLKGHKSTELKEDISRKSQIAAGIISYGGVILDGNRRYMVLKELYQDELTKRNGTPEKFQYMDVVRLPENLTKQVLLEIQARNQMAKDFKEAYNPINQLLAIRKFKMNNFSDLQISSLLNLTIKEVKDREQQLDLIDEFLESNNRDFEYELIQIYKIIDHFTEFRIQIQGHPKRSGREGEELKAKLDQMKEIFFKWLQNNIDDKMVDEGNTMGSREIVRNLKIIVEDPELDSVLEKVLREKNDDDGKRKVHRLMTGAVRAADDSREEKRILTNAERVESNLTIIEKLIDNREVEFDEDELLEILNRSKHKLNKIIKSITNDSE